MADAPWFALVLGVFACWRLSTLLVYDDGPWDVVLRLRRAAGNGAIARMLDCFRCTSLWVAAPLALAVGRTPLEWLLAWPALSGAACLLERIGQPPLSMQPMPMDESEGESHELLRTRPRGAGDGGQPPARRTDAFDTGR